MKYVFIGVCAYTLAWCLMVARMLTGKGKIMEYICIYVGAATLAWCFIKFVEVIDR